MSIGTVGSYTAWPGAEARKSKEEAAETSCLSVGARGGEDRGDAAGDCTEEEEEAIPGLLLAASSNEPTFHRVSARGGTSPRWLPTEARSAVSASTPSRASIAPIGLLLEVLLRPMGTLCPSPGAHSTAQLWALCAVLCARGTKAGGAFPATEMKALRLRAASLAAGCRGSQQQLASQAAPPAGPARLAACCDDALALTTGRRCAMARGMKRGSSGARIQGNKNGKRRKDSRPPRKGAREGLGAAPSELTQRQQQCQQPALEKLPAAASHSRSTVEAQDVAMGAGPVLDSDSDAELDPAMAASSQPGWAPITDRLNPARNAFDPEFKAQWRLMTKAQRKKLLKRDRKEIAAVRARSAGIVHPFAVVSDDHCETSPTAYEHVAPLLHQLAGRLGKPAAELAIYDPYFCAGSVVRHLNKLGFRNVYNRNEDFYAALVAGELPEHDVLLTNPPYSGDHVERLAKFAAANGKPFLLLLPDHFAGRPSYARALGGLKPLLLVPEVRYHYWTPAGLRDGAGNAAAAAAAVPRAVAGGGLRAMSVRELRSRARLAMKAVENHEARIDAAVEGKHPKAALIKLIEAAADGGGGGGGSGGAAKAKAGGGKGGAHKNLQLGTRNSPYGSHWHLHLAPALSDAETQETIRAQRFEKAGPEAEGGDGSTRCRVFRFDCVDQVGEWGSGYRYRPKAAAAVPQ
jgi:hypothetical protein